MILNRLALIGGTVSPGLFKILLLTYCSFSYGLNVAGSVGALLFVGNLINAVLIDGLFSTLNREITSKTKYSDLIKVVGSRFAVLLVIGGAVIFITSIYIGDALANIFGVGYILFSFSRFVIGVQRRYWDVLRLDIIVYLMFPLLIYCGFDVFSAGVIFFIPFFVCLWVILSDFNFDGFDKFDKIEKSVWSYSLNGLISSGVGYLVPIFIFSAFGAKYAGILSILISYAGFILAVPRAIGKYYISVIGEMYQNGRMVNGSIMKFTVIIIFSFLLSIPLFYLLYHYLLYFEILSYFPELKLLMVALFMFYFASQLSLPLSLTLIIISKPKLIFTSNIFYSIATVVLLIFVGENDGGGLRLVIEIVYVYALMSLFQLIKYSILLLGYNKLKFQSVHD